MKVEIRIGDRVLKVDAEPPGDDGILRLDVDGEAIEVDVRSTQPGHHAVRIGEHAATLHVAVGEDGTWVGCEGRAWRVAGAGPEGRRARSAGHATAGTVTPPMPSMVARVLVEVGQVVTRGQGLVVVSAMKMEATLVAPHDGTVRAIRTQPGANVRPGDVLVEVEPS